MSASEPTPDDQPLPQGGWSESLTVIRDAIVVPPSISSFVQQAGVLYPDGRYCDTAAMWRKFRPLTIQPDMPERIDQTLSGRWLWGGVLWAHFGHFLTESAARIWALDRIEGDIDGVLFIPKRPRKGEETRGFQHEYLSLFQKGLTPRAVAQPTQVQELIVPGQGFGLGKISAGTPAYRDAVHRHFARDIAPEGPERLYISRSKLGLGHGGLLGEKRLEGYLRAEGYTVFHPQDHTLSEQIARYKAARYVIAADGSSLHLFAMVGRPEQRVAIIQRRLSGANDWLAVNVASFCQSEPLSIDALVMEWVPHFKQKSSRESIGELDYALVGQKLREGGFICHADNWHALSDVERDELMAQSGMREDDRFVPSPKFEQERLRKARRARRARREARQQS